MLIWLDASTCDVTNSVDLILRWKENEQNTCLFRGVSPSSRNPPQAEEDPGEEEAAPWADGEGDCGTAGGAGPHRRAHQHADGGAGRRHAVWVMAGCLCVGAEISPVAWLLLYLLCTSPAVLKVLCKWVKRAMFVCDVLFWLYCLQYIQYDLQWLLGLWRCPYQVKALVQQKKKIYLNETKKRCI